MPRALDKQAITRWQGNANQILTKAKNDTCHRDKPVRLGNDAARGALPTERKGKINDASAGTDPYGLGMMQPEGRPQSEQEWKRVT
jgi:hypothetical protein